MRLSEHGSITALPRPWRAWLSAARPATLPASIVPVLVGSAAALSEGYFRPDVLVGALLAALMIQVGANYSNDYFDYRKGADTPKRKGPVRLIQSGLATSQQVLAAALLCFGLAMATGVYLVFVGGWVILAVGLACILAGLAYTGGPFPLSYHALGDLAAFIFFGVLGVSGTFYLHTGFVSPLAWWASIPVGLLIADILIVNNVRDIETDRAAGKITLAVVIGRTASRIEYALFLVLAYLVPLGLWLGGCMSAWFWLPFLTLPVAVYTTRGVSTREDGPTLNGMLKLTARLNLLYGILFSAALLL